jgi:hypothetical protein
MRFCIEMRLKNARIGAKLLNSFNHVEIVVPLGNGEEIRLYVSKKEVLALIKGNRLLTHAFYEKS